MADALGIDQSNYCNIENSKLFFNGLPELKKNAIFILMPKLKSKLDQLKNEVIELKAMKEALNN